MKSVFLFGVASFIVFVAAAAVSVYSFDQYEHAWGRGGSLQVEAWLSLVGALIAMGAFGIGSTLAQRVHSREGGIALGAFCSILFIFICWIANVLAPSVGVYVALLLLIALSGVASLAGSRV